MQEHKGRERKSDWITFSLFPSTPWKDLSFVRTFDPEEKGRIETVQVQKEHEGFKKIS